MKKKTKTVKGGTNAARVGKMKATAKSMPKTKKPVATPATKKVAKKKPFAKKMGM